PALLHRFFTRPVRRGALQVLTEPFYAAQPPVGPAAPRALAIIGSTILENGSTPKVPDKRCVIATRPSEVGVPMRIVGVPVMPNLRASSTFCWIRVLAPVARQRL